MKKRVLKIAAFVTALILIGGVIWFANGLVGNPISKALATHTAEKHLEAQYGDTDFVLEGVTFSFKHGYYHAYISSPSSVDSSFALAIALNGRLLYDYYENNVLTGRNTADRIEKDYRAAVDAVLESRSFPYDAHIGFGDLEFVSRENSGDPSVPDYAIVTEDLTLDAFYNVNELGARSGKLTLYLYADAVSVERLSEILLDIRRIFDGAGVRFYVIDCVLEFPKSEDGSRNDARVEVMEFLYSDIYEEGMTDRVRASDEAARAYYAAEDAKKFKEKE